MNSLAPIALFVYKRPSHTRRTVGALQANELAGESDLFIFSDAPKKPEDVNSVHEVREYIKTINGFRTVNIIEKENNEGLANSIIGGVSRLCNDYGKVIVVEDDLVTSPYFLSFMNDALDFYQNDEKVMHISGYMFPIDNSGLPETFFLRATSCWGWATWNRAWKFFKKEPKKLINEYSNRRIRCFNMDGAYDYWSHVVLNERGIINTWAIFWYASVFQQGGLCLHPAISMVNNIGFDGTGENCGEAGYFSTSPATKPITCFEKNITENMLAYTRTRNFYLSLRPNFLGRGFAAIRNRLKRYWLNI